MYINLAASLLLLAFSAFLGWVASHTWRTANPI